MTLPALKTFGISDDDVRRERELQVKIYRATINLLAVLNEIKRESAVVQNFGLTPLAFRNFVHDELPFSLNDLGHPDFAHWEELISEARNP